MSGQRLRCPLLRPIMHHTHITDAAGGRRRCPLLRPIMHHTHITDAAGRVPTKTVGTQALSAAAPHNAPYPHHGRGRPRPYKNRRDNACVVRCCAPLCHIRTSRTRQAASLQKPSGQRLRCPLLRPIRTSRTRQATSLQKPSGQRLPEDMACHIPTYRPITDAAGHVPTKTVGTTPALSAVLRTTEIQHYKDKSAQRNPLLKSQS